MRRRRLLPKPLPPPDGMMYSSRGELIPIEAMEYACQMLMIGINKNDSRHWSRDPDYFLADKIREARKNG